MDPQFENKGESRQESGTSVGQLPSAPRAPAVHSTPASAAAFDQGGGYLDQISRRARQNEPVLRNPELSVDAATGGRIFHVTFSGMNSNGGAAQKLAQHLVRFGVPDNQVIVTNSTSAKFATDGAYGYAANVYMNVESFNELSNPQSASTRSSSRSVDLDLKLRGFDRTRDKVVLIGHSKGGQEALSVGENLEQRGINVSHVITLGTPVNHDGTRNARVFHVAAADDPVLTSLSKATFGYVDESKSGSATVMRVPDGGHSGYLRAPDFYDVVKHIFKS